MLSIFLLYIPSIPLRVHMTLCSLYTRDFMLKPLSSRENLHRSSNTGHGTGISFFPETSTKTINAARLPVVDFITISLPKLSIIHRTSLYPHQDHCTRGWEMNAEKTYSDVGI